MIVVPSSGDIAGSTVEISGVSFNEMLGIVTRISSSGVGLKERIEGEEEEADADDDKEEEEEEEEEEEPNVLKDKGVIEEADDEEVVGIERSMVSIEGEGEGEEEEEEEEEERRGV